MSAYIKCKLEIKSVDMLKKVLDVMGLHYQEGQLIAKGYGSMKKAVDILISKEELKKQGIFSWGDMGFSYNEKTQTYDAVIDESSKEVIGQINQIYAVETIKNFATANRYNYTIIENNGNKMNQNTIIEVF